MVTSVISFTDHLSTHLWASIQFQNKHKTQMYKIFRPKPLFFWINFKIQRKIKTIELETLYELVQWVFCSLPRPLLIISKKYSHNVATFFIIQIKSTPFLIEYISCFRLLRFNTHVCLICVNFAKGNNIRTL